MSPAPQAGGAADRQKTAKGSLRQGSLGLRPGSGTPHSARRQRPARPPEDGGRNAVGTALPGGDLSGAAAVAGAVAGPGTVARPVAARSVVPGPEVAAALSAALSLPAAASVTRRPAGAVAGTVSAGAGTVAVGAGSVAVAGFRRLRQGVHERQSGTGKAKGGKKLSASHGGSSSAHDEDVAPLHASGVPAGKTAHGAD